jgi:replicative DNA helicase
MDGIEQLPIELTKEEAAELSKLVNPDAEKTNAYKWDEDFQKELLGLLLHDRNFLLESLAIIKPNYFINENHRHICEILFKHFDKYQTLPSRVQMINELNGKLDGKADEIKVLHIGGYNEIILDYLPGMESRDYYRDKIVNFAKTQALKQAFRESLQAIKEDPESDDTWETIHDVLREALTVEHNFDFGLDYFQTIEERYDRMNKDVEMQDRFTSGFPAIDMALAGEGMKRGEIGSWVGLSGTGKSLALKVAAIANITKKKKVLYISLEIDQDGVAERFDAELSSMIQNPDVGEEDKITINNLLDKKQLVFDFVKEYQDDVCEEERMLVIKQFPGGQMDMASFRAYHSQLGLRGFHPDLVIIDYIGEMKDYAGIPTHESRYRMTRDLRGFAVEENVLVLTAMQPNRSAKEVIRSGQLIDDENLGDSYAQIKPLDAMWTINQLQEEKDCGLARIYVAKHRSGKSRFSFHVEINYDTLAIKEISYEKYSKILKEYRNTKEETTTSVMNDDQKVRSFIDNNQREVNFRMEG